MINFWNDLELHEEQRTSRFSLLLSFFTHCGTLCWIDRLSLVPQILQRVPNSLTKNPYFFLFLNLRLQSLLQNFCSPDRGLKISSQFRQVFGFNFNRIPPLPNFFHFLWYSLSFSLSEYGIIRLYGIS